MKKHPIFAHIWFILIQLYSHRHHTHTQTLHTTIMHAYCTYGHILLFFGAQDDMRRAYELRGK